MIPTWVYEILFRVPEPVASQQAPSPALAGRIT